MRHLLIAAALAAATVAPANAEVGVSLSVGEPGFYGRIDIGDFPPPQLIYGQPVIVQEVPLGRPPVYLHVPPNQVRYWRRYCHRYNACGERVYFVQDTWYDRVYVPSYRERHRAPSRGRPPMDSHRPGPGPDRHGPPGPGPGFGGPDRHDDRRH